MLRIPRCNRCEYRLQAIALHKFHRKERLTLGIPVDLNWGWEQGIFALPDLNDFDDDGLTNYDESRLGTDPLDASSIFHLLPTTQPSGNLSVTWPSTPGTFYQITSSPDLTDWTTVVVASLPADSGANTSYDLGSPGAAKMFYRVSLND